MMVTTMKHSMPLKALLLISGAIAIGVGAAILFAPAAFHASAGIAFGADPSLLSEIRAPGGALLVLGFLMLAGVFVAEFAFVSITIAAGVYLSYGASRLFSMAIDGTPHATLIGAAVLELVIGALTLLALLQTTRKRAALETRRQTAGPA